MDFFSFLRRSPERQIEKLRKKVKEPHGDASVRQGAAQKLAEMGTPQAIRALLDRFSISVSPSIQDEREKEEVFGWLVSIGRPVVEPLIDFLKRERAVYWPARALREILEEAEQCREFEKILVFLREHPPATAVPKAQLIRSLGSLDSERLREVVRRFLDDEDDDVRLAAVEYLMDRPEEDGRQDVLQCYLNSDDRPRIRSRILELFAEKGWSVRGFRPAVEETLPEAFSLTREGRLRRVGP